MLKDLHNRTLNYLRLSVTDRCNLRCTYCMPENIRFVNKDRVLTFEEMDRLMQIMARNGVNKVRITGGEPFVRKDLMSFLRKLVATAGIDEVAMTTNATVIRPYISELKQLGIHKLNVSLDTLDKGRFFDLTRRDQFDEVFASLMILVEEGFDVKVNAVIMDGKNTDDILPFVELTRKHALNVRFLEEMPFNGGGKDFQGLAWNYKQIYNSIQSEFQHIKPLENEPNATATNYQVDGFEGSFGIIPAFSRTFCGSCNRLRLNATGELRTCLYGKAATNLRDLLRDGADDSTVEEHIKMAVGKKPKDGFIAEKEAKDIHESMSVLGG